MSDLETRLRETLQQHAAVKPIAMPKGTGRRVRVRRTATAVAVTGALVVFVAAAAFVVPRGLRAIRHSPAARANRYGATPESWPKVVIGDPANGYVGPKYNQEVLGQKYLLTSGTVDGREFSLVGYSQRTPEACLEMAGPATSDHFQSPGPHPPGAIAATGGVGGFCLPEQIPATLLRAGWPDFPGSADIFLRAAGKYVGFVTERVSRLEVHLPDGTVVDVPILHFPNQWNYGAFIFFPPTMSISGDLEAFDAAGNLLASAPLCGPDDGIHSCGVAPTHQLVPVGIASASP